MKTKQIMTVVIGALFVSAIVFVNQTKLPRPAQLSEVAKPYESVGSEAADVQAQAGVESSGTAPAAAYSGIVKHTKIHETPAWAVPYGKEFWRRPVESAADGSQSSTVPNINLGDVMERVSHAIAHQDASGFPQLRARTFNAAFNGEGFRLSPHIPAGDVERHQAVELAEGDTFRPDDAREVIRMYEPDPNTEITFKTLSVKAGEDVLYQSAGPTVPWSVIGNTAQGLLNERAGIIEHYETRGEGVEVTWVLRDKPVAQGVVQIEAEISGLTYAGETDSGHHYADDAGIARVKVGKAHLVDANGMQVEVPVTVSGSVLRLSVASEIVAGLEFPIAIDPVVGPEFGMGVPMATGNQRYPATAFNGSVCLVAWEDYRNGPKELHGARVQSDGKVLDPSGILIGNSSYAPTLPSIASDGVDFLVTWHRTGGSPATYDIYAARVSGAGVLLDGVPLYIATTSFLEKDAAVAYAGGYYLVVWDTDGGIKARRVQSDGMLLDYPSFTIDAASGTSAPSVAANGSNFLVVWGVAGTVNGRRVSPSGVMLDASPVVYSAGPNAGGPAVASNGSDYLIVWQQDRSWAGTGIDILGSRVSGTSGWDLDSGSYDLQIAIDPSNESSPSVGSFGTDYVVVWQENSGSGDIAARRVLSSGLVTGNKASICNLATTQRFPSIARLGSGMLITWEDARFGFSSLDIQGAMFIPATDPYYAGSAVSYHEVSTSGAQNVNQANPAVVYSGFPGFNYFVVWEDRRNYGSSGIDIYGARVQPDGVILDLSGIAICTAAGDQERPGVAFNGTYFLASWMDRRGANYDIYGGRLTYDGVPLDGSGFGVCGASGDQQYPSVASLGGAFFIVWQDNRFYNDIYGSRVGNDGTIIDSAGIIICEATGGQRVPKVAGLGTEYFVVWFDQNYYGSTGYDIMGARVNTSGQILNPTPISICNAASSQYYCSLATDGLNYLVAWQDLRSSNWDIYGSRVSAAGTVLDASGIPISTAANSQQIPTVASKGSDYLVVWSDSRVSSSSPDLYGARVTSAGSVSDPSGFTIGQATASQTASAVASDGTKYLVLYQNTDATSLARVRANLITP